MENHVQSMECHCVLSGCLLPALHHRDCNPTYFKHKGFTMTRLRRLWIEDAGQDIAEYALMLAVILVIVVGTIQLIGSSANNVFSNAASSIQ
jgi:Flp pilus assembly pilin Flp